MDNVPEIQLTNELANQIIDSIKNQIQSEDFKQFEKDNPLVSNQIKNLTVKDLSFDPYPIIFDGHIDGDYTADGFRYTNARGKNLYSKFDAQTSLDDSYRLFTYKYAGVFSTDII